VPFDKFVARASAFSPAGVGESQLARIWQSTAEPLSGYRSRIDHPPRVGPAEFGG
jgi:hypothetical protein